MKALKGLLKAHTRLISKLETLADKNDQAVESNTQHIKKLQEENLDLVAEAQASRNIAGNLRKLISEEVGE